MNIKQAVAAAVLGAASVSASALPVSGGISFSSDGSPFSFNTTTNTVDFSDLGTNAVVDSVSGDFANYFSVNNAATFHDFVYDPFSGPVTIWDALATVGGNAGTSIQFDLNSATTLLELSNLVVLEGVGELSGGGSTQSGIWNISMNSAGGTFSWSASTAAVPEPSMFMLFGLGLAGVGLARRRVS